MRIFVAGGSGAVGKPLVTELLQRNLDVTVLTRSAATADRLAESGAKAVVGDALDRDSVVAAIERSAPEVVIHQLTAIPKVIPLKKMVETFEQTNRLRTQGTSNLIEGARKAGAHRFIAQSIAFAYAPEGALVKDEEALLYLDAPESWRPINEAVNELETLVLESELDGVVLRYGFFYGPGTSYAHDGHLANEARKRRVPIVGSGDGVFSFIHVDDAARAAVTFLADGTRGIYNVVDDDPAPAREWIPEFAAAVGAPKPMHVPAPVARLAAGKYGVYAATELTGASNAKIKRDTTWRPAHPTWRGVLGALGG
ncbi:MAG: NAD-dependent epimerase/dehydratase family protein [Actinomycetota bacterium]